MKFNVLRNLLLPWLVFFIFASAFTLFLRIELRIDTAKEPLYLGYLAVSSLICLFFNVRTLMQAGIWMAYSLPLSVRFSSTQWVFRAGASLLASLSALALAELSWMPLLWKGIVTPLILFLCLFFFIRSLLGVILKSCSNVLLGRTLAFALSIPLFTLVPWSVVYTSQIASSTYWETFADMDPSLNFSSQGIQATSGAALKPKPSELPVKNENNEDLQKLAELVQKKDSEPKLCQQNKALILRSLLPTAKSEQVLHAIALLKCSEIRSLVGLQALLNLITTHPAAEVRALALRTLPIYGNENLKRVSYLLFKKITESEQEEVILSAAKVLAPLGELERAFVKNRLKKLLESQSQAQVAAQTLGEVLGEKEFLAQWIEGRIHSPGLAAYRAMSLICSLDESNKSRFKNQISVLLSGIQIPSDKDPAYRALKCLESSALPVLVVEFKNPKFMKQSLSASLLADLDLPKDADLMKRFEACAMSSDPELSKACSRGLAKMGADAIPSIVELLRSKNPLAASAGKAALGDLKDPSAKEALLNIKFSNSGWTANREKLEIARAAQSALKQLESSNQNSTIK